MKNPREGILNPIMPKIDYSLDGEKATVNDIFLEQISRDQARKRGKRMQERAKALGFDVIESEHEVAAE